jgi:hypothetical protein
MKPLPFGTKRSSIALLLAALATVALAQEPLNVRGLIVDSEGRPVAGAEVATMWTVSEGRMVPAPNARRAVTNEEGKAAFSMPAPVRRQILIAYDASRERAGLGFVEPGPAQSEIEIRLEPVARVRNPLEIAGWKGDFPSGTCNFNLTAPNLVTSTAVQTGFAQDIEVRLPAGTFGIALFSLSTETAHRRIEVKAGELLVLEPIKLETSHLATLFDKPAPEITVTDARGVEGSFDLANYRGRWVLLEFWAVW